jgi:hypothetical protein
MIPGRINLFIQFVSSFNYTTEFVDGVLYLGLAASIRDGLDICSMNEMEQLFVAMQELGFNKDKELRERIQRLVNDLIITDFDQLVQLLYRIDVNENKLKKLLHDRPQTDAAVLITDLLIERQLEKIKSKESLKNQKDIPDEEKW